MKVCFVGVGSIGKRHIRNLVNICNEMNEKLVIHLLRTHMGQLDDDIAKVVSRETMNKQELDVWYDMVFITNPTSKHFETLFELQNISNYFFIEKPVFETYSKNISGIQLKDKVFYIACPLRYTMILQDAMKLLKNEKVLSVRAICSSYLPEWRPNIDYRNNYSAHKEQGGGVRCDLIHEWDYLITMFGFPEKVLSHSGKYSNLEINSEDIVVYIGLYKDKVVELHLDYIGRQSRRQLEVRTNDAEYIFDILGGHSWINGKVFKNYREDSNDKYIREMRTFINLVNGKGSNPNDIVKAMKVLEIANQ